MKLLLIVALLVVVGVGLFVLSQQEEEPKSEVPENQAQDSEIHQPEEPFEISQELAQNILKNALDARFDAKTATYKIANLDHQGGTELIVGAATQHTAIIQVLTVVNQKGEYEQVGKLEYQEQLQGVPEVKELVDITGDGQEEIIVSLMYGGAASWTEGILEVDIPNHTLQWIQLRLEHGRPYTDAIFTLTASTMYWSTIKFTDIDHDQKMEITQIFAQRDLLDPEKVQCYVNVYEWDLDSFTFDRRLSAKILENLSADCAI
jgi:hypothetical protein